jgi:DNA polymerase bacteriophage-type
VSGALSWIRENYKNPMDVFSSIIRGVIIPPHGQEFFCADFAAVEARIAFWVAGHDEGVQAFLDNRKLYEEMASEAFQMPIEEVTKDSLERFVGKESVLGCQYGMGWKKFKSQCWKKGVKRVDDEMAKKAVYAYRKLHWPVPQAWKDLEKAVVAAIRTGDTFQVCKSRIYLRGDWLNIQLPSGRRLRYYKPRVSYKQLASGHMVPEIRFWGIEHYQWCETTIWGGIFFNHIVQGVARDLLAFSMMGIEESGYCVVVHAHDEVLAERKIGEGNLDEYLSLMTKMPDWAADAPIRAEGWVGKRYRK